MKHLTIIFLAALGILFLANWGTPESNSDEPRKNSLNFYGNLETWQGQTYEVENISLDHRIKKIEMYEKPIPTQHASPSSTTPQEETVLGVNPITNFTKVYIDLAEIKSLEIPDPEKMWIYHKKRGQRELIFLEIVVTNNDSQETKNTYLIENRKKLYCDRRIGTSLEEREVPLIAIKKLSVEGYRQREPRNGRRSYMRGNMAPIEAPAALPVA
ncbi:hypothetical protein KJZ61_03660 [Candidatus Dependentiae bacterium]|nr:hypothetical protein [Candidatus Dependentiae bacterium]